MATCIPVRRTRRHASTCDSRHGLNTQFRLPDLLRQSMYSRLAGNEDLNDAARLATDPTFSPPWVAEYVGPRRGADLDVALAELLTRKENLVRLRGPPLPAHRLLGARSPLPLALLEMVHNMV
ncbi:MAG TPA: hypothetical protein VG055_06395 [Planctomycetaceae bacterium]|nr:hypothetical protein [Planctomycetaceae bacterium]